MNIFDDDVFKVFDDTVNNIYNEYKSLLDFFDGDIHKYISGESNPYCISVSVQEVVDFVDEYFIELSGSVRKVFNSVQKMNGISDDFIKYYTLLNEVIESGLTDEVTKTKKIALVLILLLNKVKSKSNSKVQLVLKSMCKNPTVGMLVQVSSRVLSEA